MRYGQYKFNFYLNASHAIYIDGKLGKQHPHTWEIVIRAIKSNNDFVMFNAVEKTIEDFLGQYQNRYLNDCQPFDLMNPTLEYITSYFLEKLEELLEPLGWVVFYIEISETPTRSYVISRVENNIISDLKQKNVVADIIADSFE